MTKTRDGVDVEIWHRKAGPEVGPAMLLRLVGHIGAWRETDCATVEEAVAFVESRTWDEVRLGCL